VPAVVDADALFALDPAFLSGLPSGTRVLTPHAGEFERLTHEPHAPDRIEQARRWSSALQATLVLKGAPTLTVYADQCFVAPSAPTGLATAGSGDTLAGAIGALLAQRCDRAAALAVHLGCRAAERLERRMRPESITAPDLIGEWGAYPS
jgi:NAD(P)H-hydrate repair Nnr-like enzyme with NAD(P)H-hydrate dehydratase domain